MNLLPICQSCRNCCTNTDIRVTDEDIERWKKENRLDILLTLTPNFGGSRQLLKKKYLDECVFLAEDGRCMIHETKPYICRKFPTSRKHAESFYCKLIDIIELKD